MSVWPLKSRRPLKPMRPPGIMFTPASPASVTFEKRWSTFQSPPERTKRSAPRPSGPFPARTRLFGKRWAYWFLPAGTRARSCAPAETVIVFSARLPSTLSVVVSALCASRTPARTSTVPRNAPLASFVTTSVPAPILTSCLMSAPSGSAYRTTAPSGTSKVRTPSIGCGCSSALPRRPAHSARAARSDRVVFGLLLFIVRFTP